MAGGSGTRLRPFTNTSAKQLLPVANVPIIEYAIRGMASAGISEISIIVGHTAEQVKAALGSGEQFGVRITYVMQDAPLGLAHCVSIAEESLNSEPFIMFLGDNMLKDSLIGFAESLNRLIQVDGACLLAVKEVTNPSAFGVATINTSGQVLKVEEKPDRPQSNLALVGVYGFSSDIFKAVRDIEPSARGELEITDAIQLLLQQSARVETYDFRGWWFDTGNLESWLACNSAVLEDLELTDSAAMKLDGSFVSTKASVSEGVKLTNCYIGDGVSIGPNCQLENITIRNSIVLRDCVLTGPGIIQNSAIGAQSHMTLENDVIIEGSFGDNSNFIGRLQ